MSSLGWMPSVFNPRYKNKEKPIPQKPLIMDYVICVICENRIARAKLDKTLYIYRCHYGHEFTVEHYNFIEKNPLKLLKQYGL